MRKRVNVQALHLRQYQNMYKKKFLNYIDNRIIVMEYATSARKRYKQNLKKHPKRPLVVTNKYPENQDVFNS